MRNKSRRVLVPKSLEREQTRLKQQRLRVEGRRKVKKKPFVVIDRKCILILFALVLTLYYNIASVIWMSSSDSSNSSSSNTNERTADDNVNHKKDSAIFFHRDSSHEQNNHDNQADTVEAIKRAVFDNDTHNNQNNKDDESNPEYEDFFSSSQFLMDSAGAGAATRNKPPRTVQNRHDPSFSSNPHGHGVKPQHFLPVLLELEEDNDRNSDKKDRILHNNENNKILFDNNNKNHNNRYYHHPDPEHILKAYIEPIDWNGWWNTKPLPIRNYTSTNHLKVKSYPNLKSCKHLPTQWPVDDYPDEDPFLPWIHDVFPTHDGKYIQFVAINRRKCNTGGTHSKHQQQILAWTQPQSALFQHVPIQRIYDDDDDDDNHTTIRYKLSTSHKEADKDAIATRFMCRFQPNAVETLSVFNLDYDFAAHRRRLEYTFHEFEGGIGSIHTNQLLFKCPVPRDLIGVIATTNTTTNDDKNEDWTRLFLDLITIRTLPRYGKPNQFLQPYYKSNGDKKDSKNKNEKEENFHPILEWGKNHILPHIEQSGRWENIPICKPSFETYYQEAKGEKEQKNQHLKAQEGKVITRVDNNIEESNRRANYLDKIENRSNHDVNNKNNAHEKGNDTTQGTTTKKKHRLVACVWASAGYSTRGNRFAINDGQRRLYEWIIMNVLIGFDHFYIYDNSHAFSSSETSTLKPIVDLFPGTLITYIPWPHKVCNNNPHSWSKSNTNAGYRSSQYAAEASCYLRFGPYTDWIGQFDIDEYIIPMGEYNSLLRLLDEIDNNDDSNKYSEAHSHNNNSKKKNDNEIHNNPEQDQNMGGKEEDEEEYGNVKILSFRSWRSLPRRDYIEKPKLPLNSDMICGMGMSCFQLQIPYNHTVLQTYNCDDRPQQGASTLNNKSRKIIQQNNKSKRKSRTVPAEKQIYRPDYVKQHFVHYSTVTVLSDMNQDDWEKNRASVIFSNEKNHKANNNRKRQQQFSYNKAFPDPLSRYVNERNEAIMIHAKSISLDETLGYPKACLGNYTGIFNCRIGIPYSNNKNNNNVDNIYTNETSTNNTATFSFDELDWANNCYVNKKIEEYWVPLLKRALEKKKRTIIMNIDK